MAADKNYNLLLVSIDCWRHDHFSTEHTPNIEKFSKDCYIFDQAYANGPWTPPSLNSLITSTFPFMYKDYAPLPKQKTTIAEVLAANGLFTFALNSNTFSSHFFRYDRGFDVFIETGEVSTFVKLFMKIRDVFISVVKDPRILRIVNVVDRINDSKDFASEIKILADRLVASAKYFLKTVKKQKFGWLHFMDCHSPYQPPKQFLKLAGASDLAGRIPLLNKYHRMLNRMSETGSITTKTAHVGDLKRLYHASLRFVDDRIGSLFSFLEERAQLENTIIVLTADHGELFMEHGFIEHPARMYEELLHIPLMIYIPPALREHLHLTGPGHIGTHVDLLHVAPTLLDLLDVKIPPSFIGRSLMPLLTKVNGRSFFPLIAQSYKMKDNSKTVESGDVVEKLVSVQTKKWKFVYDTAGDGSYTLYCRNPDINEDRNCAEDNPDVVAFFKEKVHLILTGDYSSTIQGEQVKIYSIAHKIKGL